MARSHLVSYVSFIRKTVRKSFYDNKNMANDRSDKWLMLYKMFDPRGLCVLVPGLYVSGFCITFSQKLFAQVILHVEHPLVRATNDCSEYLGHMTKMAVTPIYCENS